MSAHLHDFHVRMFAPAAPVEPSDIGALLANCVEAACARAGLAEAEIYQGGQIVTMLFSPTRAWEAVVVGPNAFQFYPGFISEDGESITWANVWVAADYDVEMFVAAVEAELEAALVEGVKQ
jgi:hypothetical protein